MQKATEKAKELSDKPTSKIRIGVLKIENSSFGYVNRDDQAELSGVFEPKTERTLKNFSNQFVEGRLLEMKGKFIGNGDTRATGAFRPETKTPDFVSTSPSRIPRCR
jgi:hypothetical protein